MKKWIIGLLIFLIVIVGILICFFCLDNFPLDMKLIGNRRVEINLLEEYNDEGVEAKYFFSDIKDKVVKEGSVDNTTPGEYIIKYSYKDMLVNKTLARTVVVIDNIAPELTLEKTKVSIYTNGVINYGKIKASDNIDGDISKSVIVNNNIDTSESGKYKIDVSVSDSSGNETVKQIDVTIKEKPVKNGKTVNARIDVYISEQKLYYFENNKLVLTSDVVTGKKDGTPRGNYKVLRKKKDIYLKGDTYLDHVDYWIAFIGRLYGIHDASWRSEFGGDIYKKNGSHGCVNMPVDNMKKLYEKVKVGTAVNIYD